MLFVLITSFTCVVTFVRSIDQGNCCQYSARLMVFWYYSATNVCLSRNVEKTLWLLRFSTTARRRDQWVLSKTRHSGTHAHWWWEVFVLPATGTYFWRYDDCHLTAYFTNERSGWCIDPERCLCYVFEFFSRRKRAADADAKRCGR